MITAGVDPTQSNLISGTFVANGTGLDGVLDKTTVNLSNPTAPTVTVSDGTTTQNTTITYDTGSSAVSFASSTANANGASVNSVSAVVPEPERSANGSQQHQCHRCRVRQYH